ncbi:MAG: TIGR04076 family protein [bacterium]|nr:TIGR04076 family protein [bacterium]
MFHPCRITVIKRMLDKELCEEYMAKPGGMAICNKVKDGQTFEVSNPYEMPEGICASAWSDIRTYIISIASGGTFKFMKDRNSILASCTDLFRPVIFKIERV